jgi:hypothetical protein
MNKVFNNLSPTPQLAEGYTMFGIMKDFFRKPKTAQPPASLPAVKTDLHRYYSKTPSVIWFGHSSYLVHCDGINILVDPVLSGHASPIKNCPLKIISRLLPARMYTVPMICRRSTC